MSDVADLFDQVQQQAGIPPIPRRPLTAYNIFSILERHYILQQHDKTVDPSEAVDTPADGNIQHEDPYVSNRPARYKDVILPQNWYVVGMNRKKRQHHKCHGVISFKALSKMISDAWNTSPDETKDYCKMISKEELRKYYEEQKKFKETYGEEAFEAQTRKRKNAEAVEAGLSKGKKCHQKQREIAAAAAAGKVKNESTHEDGGAVEQAAKKPCLMGGPLTLSPKQNGQGTQNGLMGLMGGAQSNLMGGSLTDRDMQGIQSRLLGGTLPGSYQQHNIQGITTQRDFSGLMGGVQPSSELEGRSLQGLQSRFMGGVLPNALNPDMPGSHNSMLGLMGDISGRSLQGSYNSLTGLTGGASLYSSLDFQDRELLALKSRLLERELVERALTERALRERLLAQHHFNPGPPSLANLASAPAERALTQQLYDTGAPRSAISASLQEAQASTRDARATGGTQPVLTGAALAHHLFPDVLNQAPSKASATAPQAEPGTTAAAKKENNPEAPCAPPVKTETNNAATASTDVLGDGERSALLGLLTMGGKDERK